MFRVLIADDEAVSLRFLQNVLTGYFRDFEVVAQCKNGLDALNYIREQEVDLVISDVKMPIMNGIELAKCVRRLGKKTHIVIVSGYAEFEFAKGALEAEVDDYLLKPLSISAIQKTLDDILKQLVFEQKQNRERLLQELLHGKDDAVDMCKNCFACPACRIALLHIGNLVPRSAQGIKVIYELLQTEDRDSIYLVQGRDGQEWIAFTTGVPEWRNIFPERIGGMAVTVLWDREQSEWAEICEKVQKFYRILDEQVLIGKSRFLERRMVTRPEFERLSQEELRKLDYYLNSGKEKLLEETLLKWGKEWEEKEIPQVYVQRMIEQIVERFFACRPAGQKYHIQVQWQIDNLYSEAKSIKELLDQCLLILQSVNLKEVENKRTSEEMYMQIEEYMRENYGEPITSQTICDMMGISQAYLGKLFRKYGRKSFHELLTSFRIENACKLLVEETLGSLGYIASCVGYDSQSHFCKVFKQYTGVTPGQYAREHGVAEKAGDMEDA